MRFLLFFLLPFNFVFGQSALTGKVIDEENSEPLIYCHLQLNNSSQGALTNENGEFVIRKYSLEDTLVISYLSYQTKKIAIKYLKEDGIISLSRSSNLLDEIAIVADDDYLFDILIKTKKQHKKSNSFRSKAYLNSTTSYDNKPIEIVEGYYNLESKKNRIVLKIKNGRVLLAPYDGSNFFLSQSMTELITDYSLVKSKKNMPRQPLQLSKSKMKQLYKLERSFQNEKEMAISFYPIENNTEFFSGEIWINKESYAILKIELESKATNLTPLKSIFVDMSFIRDIRYQITYEFNTQNKNQYLDYVNFNYDLNFENPEMSIYNFQTKGILKTYDIGGDYHLPYLDYIDGMNDYQLIAKIPYIAEFWKEDHGLTKTTRQKNNIDKILDTGYSLSGVNALTVNKNKPYFFEYSNVFWSRIDRVKFNQKKRQGEFNLKNIHDIKLNSTKFRSDKINLTFQLFLDVTNLRDTTLVKTKTLLDAYESYNFLERSTYVDAYINMCFDVAEIQRRELHNDVLKSDFVRDNIDVLHTKHVKEMENQLRELQNDCALGSNMNGMIKWNDHIIAKLDIDNIKIFSLGQESID